MCLGYEERGVCGKGKRKEKGEEKKILRNIIAIMKKNCVALRYRDFIFGLLDLISLNAYNKLSIFLSAVLSISLLDMHLLYWD